MYKLFLIVSNLMLILCGMFIGAWIECGYTHLFLVGIILSLFLHYAYVIIAGRYIKSEHKVHIRELRYGDDKPEDMPDEVWDKVQALLSVTACPDKTEPVEPVEPVDTGESDEP